MNDSDKLKGAFDEAAVILTASLKKGGEVDENAKLAMQMIIAFARMKATERANQTLQYFVIRDFANHNLGELKKMVKTSLPELNPKPQLP